MLINNLIGGSRHLAVCFTVFQEKEKIVCSSSSRQRQWPRGDSCSISYLVSLWRFSLFFLSATFMVITQKTKTVRLLRTPLCSTPPRMDPARTLFGRYVSPILFPFVVFYIKIPSYMNQTLCIYICVCVCVCIAFYICLLGNFRFLDRCRN
jgi:hypothetical protein